jgi:tetratricopeptide (TPR) repeat protein
VRAPVPEEAPYESPYASDPGPEPATHSETRSRSTASDIEDAIFEDAIFDEAAPAANRSSRRPSTAPPAYHDDDDDIPNLPGRSGSPLLWLVLIVAIGALALIAAQRTRIAMLLGVGSDPALIAAGVAEGDAALAEGHPEAYASAIEAYGHALAAGGDRDPEILAKLSQASALAAQAQLETGGTADSIASLTAGALTAAERASKLDPDDVEVKLGLADALRLTGENAEARLVLEEARAMPFSRTAEFFRVDARLSAAEADGRLQEGLRSARQAVELAPHGVPYLLLLARAERASGDESAARIPLETVLADHPNHPVAAALLAEMKAAAAVEDAVATVDAGTVLDAAAAETETEKEPATQAEGPATSKTAASEPAAAPVDTKPKSATATRTPLASKAAAEKASVPSPEPARSRKPVRDEYDRLAEAAGDDAFVDGRPPVRDYEWYMREGQAELAAGNYSRARAFFDSALEARPGSADAMDGLGKVSVRIEDFDLAIRYFRVAAQRGRPDGYFNLGKVYERIGRNEEAVSAYYTYLKRNPTGTHAAAARLAIKALEPRAKLPPELEPDPETGTLPSSEPSRAEEPTQDSEPATP